MQYFRISFLKIIPCKKGTHYKKLKNLIKKKNASYKLYLASDKATDTLETINSLQYSLNCVIENAKNKLNCQISRPDLKGT